VQDVDDLNTGRANGYVSGQIYYDVVMVGCLLRMFIQNLFAFASFSCLAAQLGLRGSHAYLASREPCHDEIRKKYDVENSQNCLVWKLSCLLSWLQARYGDPRIAVAIMTLPAMAMFFCGASCVTSNSRCVSLPACTLNLA